MAKKYRFERLTLPYYEIVLSWLYEPHMQEFWDNSQDHKDDILNFVNGRKSLSTYFNGIFTYWLGFIENNPFAFFLTAPVKNASNLPQLWSENLSKTGATYSIDFAIGDKNFLGKGLAASTLEAFVHFFKSNIDGRADTFFIDLSANNSRAAHVYMAAGFKQMGLFSMSEGYFQNDDTILMVKSLV